MHTIFDLETVPIDDAATYLKPVEAEPVSAPANYKDPAKIEEYIARATAAAEEKRAAAEAERVARCALDPDLCRIVALGWQREIDGDDVRVELCGDEAQEQSALRSFWANTALPFVGFNIAEFDLRVLYRRSLYLGVRAKHVRMGRYEYQRPDVIDLMMRLCWDDPRKAHSLSFYTQRFSLDPVDDNVTGEDIPRLVAEGRWAEVENHCRADVIRTKQLAQRIGAIPSSVPVFTDVA